MLKESPAEQLGAPHPLGKSSMGQKGLTAPTPELGRSCNLTHSPRICPHPEFSQQGGGCQVYPSQPPPPLHIHTMTSTSHSWLSPLCLFFLSTIHTEVSAPSPLPQPLNPHTHPEHFHPLQKSRDHCTHTPNNSGAELEQGSRSGRAWLWTHSENLLGIVGTHVLKNCIPVNNRSAGRGR